MYLPLTLSMRVCRVSRSAEIWSAACTKHAKHVTRSCSSVKFCFHITPFPCIISRCCAIGKGKPEKRYLRTRHSCNGLTRKQTSHRLCDSKEVGCFWMLSYV